MSTESNLSKSAGTWRKTWQQASHPGFCNKPVKWMQGKRVKEDHHSQGLDSDSLSHQSSKMVAKLDEDMGCDFRQRTERDQVHVSTAL